MLTRTDNFKPAAALTIYRSEKDPGNHESKVYVEMHSIDRNGNILAGRPLTESFAATLGESLTTTNLTLAAGWIPANLTYIGWKGNKPVLIWWTAPSKQEITYTEHLAIPDGTIQVPRLLWYYEAHTQNLRLFALKDDLKSMATPLFFSPFHNVGTSGNVCIGTGKKHLEKNVGNFALLMATVERVFWKTTFSALHNEKCVKGNLSAVHKALQKSRKPFDNSLLVPAKITLQQLCK